MTGALLLVWLLGGAASAAPPPTTLEAPKADPIPDPDPDPDTPTSTSTPALSPTDLPGPKVLDGVLPCGLRVVVARDVTLPVAAVVLAVETGTEDDPTSQPGLVHALAYHLLQGNRELAPGHSAKIAHDAGGLTMLAVGPAQIRYESLVPVSRLPNTLWSEAQRLRAPTVSDVLWAESLRWARRDKPRKWALPREAVAAVHAAPGIGHAGRSVGPEITNMKSRAVSEAIARRFRYPKATLTVVAPAPIEDTWAQVMEAFADLPPAPRALPKRRTVTGPVGDTPRSAPLTGAKGTTMAWPVPPSPDALLEATVWCKTLNRQRRGDGEPTRARVRCHLDVDPRRATLIVRGSGVADAEALIEARIERIAAGQDDELVDRQREIVLDDDRVTLRTPLALARRLTEQPSPDTAASGAGVERARAQLVGHAPLLAGQDTPMTFGDAFAMGAAVLFVADPDPQASPEASPKADPAANDDGGQP